MFRVLFKILLAVFVAALVLVVGVNALTPGLPEEGDLDLTQSIELEDGRVMTLGALVEASAPEASDPEAEAPSEARDRPWEEEDERPDLIEVGFHQLVRGRPEQARDVWLAVPEGHPDYARAQRFIGYKIYDQALGRPDVGLAYVNRSMWHDPMEGNVWQDAARIYMHSIGALFR